MTISTAKIIKKSALTVCGLLLFIGVTMSMALATSQPAYAADDAPADNKCTGPNGSPVVSGTTAGDPCIPSKFTNQGDPAARGECKLDCFINRYINPFINVLSAVVGIVIAGSLIWGGILYTSAGGDPSKVQAAKKRISNTIITFLGYLFLFAFLQWLIPGGIF